MASFSLRSREELLKYLDATHSDFTSQLKADVQARKIISIVSNEISIDNNGEKISQAFDILINEARELLEAREVSILERLMLLTVVTIALMDKYDNIRFNLCL